MTLQSTMEVIYAKVFYFVLKDDIINWEIQSLFLDLKLSLCTTFRGPIDLSSTLKTKVVNLIHKCNEKNYTVL